MRQKATAENELHSQVPDSLFSSRWLRRDGAELHYVDEGRGSPVLMLHGNPTWSFLYRGVIQRLRNSFRCIAPDLPGFGYSRPPEGYGYTPREHAAWVRLLLEELGIQRYILAGQDWGGPIGLSPAVESPERIEGLVLANTWCWPPFWDTRAFSLFMGSFLGRWLTRRHNVFPRWILPLGMSRASRGKKSALRAYIRPFRDPEARLAVPELAKHIRGSADWLANLEERLPVLDRVPMRLVWGMRDPIFGRHAYLQRWRAHFPRAGLDRVEGASHYLPEDAPERMAQAVRSVASTAGDEAML
ncbi:MAG: alpha/beta fold hydrolase [Desulfohalobiaceae bacterium]